MKPLFFGESERQLYGVYHPGGGDRRPRDVGVLLCYPGMHEYNMTHWAFRKLAGLLSRAGFPVLRFDYRGTGDSTGRTGEGGIAAWVGDVRTAALELRDLSGARALSLVGMRLGGALALTAVNQGLEARDVVVWDPVVAGRDYLEELQNLDASERLLRLYPQKASRAEPSSDVLGFPLPEAMRRELRAIALASPGALKLERLTIVASADVPGYRMLRDAVRASGKAAEIVGLSQAPGRSAAGGHAAVLSSEPLSVIVESLTRGDRT